MLLKMLVWQTLTFLPKVSINIPRKSHRERSKSPAHHATSSRQAGGMIMPPPSEAARLAGIIPPPSAGTEGLLPRLNAPGQANPNWIQFWVQRKPRLRLSGKRHGTQNLEQRYSFFPNESWLTQGAAVFWLSHCFVIFYVQPGVDLFQSNGSKYCWY